MAYEKVICPSSAVSPLSPASFTLLQRHLVLVPPATPGSLSSVLSSSVHSFLTSGLRGSQEELQILLYTVGLQHHGCEIRAEPPSGGLHVRGPPVCPAHSHPRGALTHGHHLPSLRGLCYPRTLGLLFFQAPGPLLLFRVCVHVHVLV